MVIPSNDFTWCGENTEKQHYNIILIEYLGFWAFIMEGGFGKIWKRDWGAREHSPSVSPHLMKGSTSLRTLYLETGKNNGLKWREKYNIHRKKASCET